MKKLLALVMAILMVLCTFASCGGGSASGNTELPDDEKQQTEDNGQSGNIENDKVAEGDKPTDEGNTDGEKIEDVKAEFNTLNLNGNFATGVVSNSSADFNFENEISIAEGMDYVVSLDENGTQILTDKQCSLVEGDNTFYIIVSKGDIKATYSITIRRKPMYEVKFNTNGGTDVTDQIVEEGSIATLPTTTREGYTFVGWDRDLSLPITEDTTISANWTANGDTPYKVEHYIENTDGSFELKETDNLSGTSDSEVTPDTKAYVEFIIPNKQTVTISADGSLVVKYYYIRNGYIVTFVTNGGNAMEPQTLKYQQTLPQATRIGYTFDGWYSDAELSTAISAVPECDITVYAKWTANDDTPYKVEYYTENAEGGFELRYTNDLLGTSDSEVTPNVIDYLGFTAPDKQTVTIWADGSQVVKYYYTRNSYTVTFVTNGGDIMEPQTLKYQQDLPQATRIGYTFGGWYSNVNLQTKVTTVPYKNITLYAYWKEENKPTDFQYSGANSIIIAKYKNAGSVVVIPAYIGGVKVTSVAASAFYNRYTLTNVTIPDTVTSIGSSAFAECWNLTSISMGNGVTSIGDSAFKNCSNLTSITIPDSLMSIATKVFDGCLSLTSITIPDGVKSISSYAFMDCVSLTSITIPDSVMSIGKNVFYNCESLTSVTIPYGDSGISEYTFYNCKSLTSVTIPDSVMSISDYAFYNCESLKNIIIPDSVTSIGDYSFSSCDNLTSVTISDNITKIGDHAFAHCYSLTSVTIPKNVTSIGEKAFYRCNSLTSISVDENNSTYTSIDGNLYNKDVQTLIRYAVGRTDTSFVIPDSVMSIEECAFEQSYALTSVTIGNGVASIGSSAFSNCYSLVEIINKSSLDIVKGSVDYGYVAYNAIEVHTGDSKMANKDGYLFYTYEGVNYLIEYTGTDIQLTLPENYNGENYKIHNYAFYQRDSLTSVTMPNSVTSIGGSAFSDCSSLASITIPDSVTSIGGSAFSGCGSLASITIPDSVTSIGESAFKGCSSLTNVTIPDSVTNLGAYAFNGCSSLTSVTIGNSVTSIEDRTFSGCNSLTRVAIPDSVTNIGKYAFQNCNSLTNVTIGNGVTSIGREAFYGCLCLTSITLGNNVMSIGEYAFDDCDSLVEVINKSSLDIVKGSVDYGYVAYNAIEVHTGDSKMVNKDGYLFYTYEDINYLVKYVGMDIQLTLPENYNGEDYMIHNYTFKYREDLTSVTIPDSVTSISDYAFYYCCGLTSITIGNGVTRIGVNAFENCYRLTRINFNGTKAEWNAISKGSNWNINTGAYTIYYTDGNI